MTSVLPMEWVTNWWPLALVIVGVWLVLASLRSRTKETSGDSQPTPDGSDPNF